LISKGVLTRGEGVAGDQARVDRNPFWGHHTENGSPVGSGGDEVFGGEVDVGGSSDERLPAVNFRRWSTSGLRGSSRRQLHGRRRTEDGRRR
jgi:hypothetical protein